MEKIELNGNLYVIEKNEKDCFNLDELLSRFTDFFSSYDYIFGDYSYDSLRLKGFYQSNHKNVTEYNDISYLNQYIVDYCSYGAKYFLLKKIK